jgi:hypothetical protein
MYRGERLDWEFLDEVFGFSDFLERVEKFEILHGDERSEWGDAVRLAVAFGPSPFHEFVQRRLNGVSGERECVSNCLDMDWFVTKIFEEPEHPF